MNVNSNLSRNKNSSTGNRINLTDKIKEMFKSEFEEKIEYILNLSSQQFINMLTRRIEIQITETNLFEKSNIEKILKEQEDLFVNETYTPISNFLHEYTAEFEERIENSKKVKNLTASRNIDIIPYLRNYRKHCNKTEQAIHSCGERLITLNFENQKFAVCVRCKKAYLANCILLFCVDCDSEYYSCQVDNLKELNYQPATWEKYHCDAIINDQMRCLKCKEIFFLNLKSGLLECLNEKCKFSIQPESIHWSCMFCKAEFKTKAKIYNPLEYQSIKIAIKDALLDKNVVKPSQIPCCVNLNENIKTLNFFHKKECDGRLLKGTLNKKEIIVCENCKSMNYYDKFIWTCPECLKRFRQKISSKDLTPIKKELKAPSSECHKRPPRMDIRNPIPGSENKANSPKRRNPVKLDLAKFNSDISKRKDSVERHSSKDIKKRLVDEFKSDDESQVNTTAPKITNYNLINIINIHTSPDKKHSQNRINLSGSKEMHINLSNDESKYFKQDSTGSEMDSTIDSKTPVSRRGSDIAKNLSFSFNFDDFQIIKQIGEGSYGVIYSVQNKYTKEIYAMKKIIAHSEKEVETFKQEYKIMNTIIDDSKNTFCRQYVLKIIGMNIKKLDSTTFALYVFSELADTDWEKEIESRHKIKKPYTEDEILEILQLSVKTLAEMQRENISHRDLKPQNILIFKKPKQFYKIADFGEAKELKLNKQQNLNTLRGTELYMSPILFNSLRNKTSNMPKINHNVYKSDVFSLGLCVFFACTLTYKSLYDIRELTDMKTISYIIQRYLKSRYSSKLINTVVKMLEYSEYKRFDFLQLEEYLESLI